MIAKSSTALPNCFYLAFNLLLLILSAVYLYRDFHENVFRIKLTAANVIQQVGVGLGLGILFALVIVCIAAFFEDISLFPPHHNSWGYVVFFVFLQLIIACAEEAFYNYYLYDSLILFTREDAVLSFLFTAAIFAFGHWAMNGIVKQTVVAFLFRSAALFVRKAFHKENAFYICSSMHFFYNLMVFFVFSV